MAKHLKKLIEENKDKKDPDLDLVDRGIVQLGVDVPGLASQIFTDLTQVCLFDDHQRGPVTGNYNTGTSKMHLDHLTRITASHNRIASIPSNIADMSNLEILNLFNNCLEELPTTLSTMPKLKILNVGMNKLNALPRGFGAFPALEVLDATYNNLNEKSLPANFFCLDTLRALYLGDNDFEMVPPEIGRLKNLQILSFRENDLVMLPKEMGDLIRLRELHIQGNRLTVLPPELGNLDLVGMKQVFKAEHNPWVTPIADQFQVGVPHVFDYIRSDTYKFLYGRHLAAGALCPPKSSDKGKKISRVKPK